jgi:hypothetical protein
MVECALVLSECCQAVQDYGGYKCIALRRKALAGSLLLLDKLLQTELLHSVTYLSQSYAQLLGRMGLDPVVSFQRIEHLLSFSFT